MAALSRYPDSSLRKVLISASSLMTSERVWAADLSAEATCVKNKVTSFICKNRSRRICIETGHSSVTDLFLGLALRLEFDLKIRLLFTLLHQLLLQVGQGSLRMDKKHGLLSLFGRLHSSVIHTFSLARVDNNPEILDSSTDFSTCKLDISDLR